jgi:hypothetical protein
VVAPRSPCSRGVAGTDPATGHPLFSGAASEGDQYARGEQVACWAAITLSVCCCFLSVACGDNAPRARGGGPGPVFFWWNYNASAGATTPQEAYARSARFTPCLMPGGETTSPDQSVTWLVSGPRVGVAYLRATCRGAVRGDYVYRGILEVVKGTGQAINTSGWSRDQYERRWPFPPTEDPHPTVAPFAPSIADLLPADTYRDWSPGRMSMPATPLF